MALYDTENMVNNLLIAHNLKNKCVSQSNVFVLRKKNCFVVHGNVLFLSYNIIFMQLLKFVGTQKYDTLNQCWPTVFVAAQHWSNIG